MSYKKQVANIARQSLANGQSGDLTHTPEYKALMSPLIEKHREALVDMGYDPDEDRDLCQWLVHHMEKDD